MSARLERPDDHAHVALVTIDRPEKANALDPITLAELAGHWRELAEDDDIRCVVLTGAGDRVFCAGMDMTRTIPVSQALARGERVDPKAFEGLRSVQTALLAGFDLRKPLVCAVNGHARAGGFDMMLASEIRFAGAPTRAANGLCVNGAPGSLSGAGCDGRPEERAFCFCFCFTGACGAGSAADSAARDSAPAPPAAATRGLCR